VAFFISRGISYREAPAGAPARRAGLGPTDRVRITHRQLTQSLPDLNAARYGSARHEDTRNFLI
jgi:hypothetical protein